MSRGGLTAFYRRYPIRIFARGREVLSARGNQIFIAGCRANPQRTKRLRRRGISSMSGATIRSSVKWFFVSTEKSYRVAPNSRSEFVPIEIPIGRLARFQLEGEERRGEEAECLAKRARHSYRFNCRTTDAKNDRAILPSYLAIYRPIRR